MSSVKDVFAVIMAGGKGSRMHPLTKRRSKPDIPIGGKYRLIDIPISNCINSGIHRIAVLTQYNSASLHRHIANTYNYLLGGSLQILAASQTPECEDWYQGTADAMRKQIAEIQLEGADYTLVLASDHLYRMDYEEMAKFHMEKKADITVAVHPVGRSAAAGFGLLKSEPDGRISRFVEKPTHPEIQDMFISRADPDEPFLASMGIYLFTTRTLIDLLTQNPGHVDFGCEVIPEAIRSLGVYGYEFDDYWQDLGTIRSFYEANLAITTPDPPFSFHSARFPIYSSILPLPGSTVVRSELSDVILTEGCHIYDARISHSIIGTESRILGGTIIKDSIIMGSDLCSPGKSHSTIPMEIGEECFVEGAILDKNVKLGKNVTVRAFPAGVEMDFGDWFVCDGIVIIPQDTEIPAGTVIAPEASLISNFAIKKPDRSQFNWVPGDNRPWG